MSNAEDHKKNKANSKPEKRVRRMSKENKNLLKKLMVAVPVILMVASVFGVMLGNPDLLNNQPDIPGAFEVGGYTFYPISEDGVFETRILHEGLLYPFRTTTDPRNATLMHMDSNIPERIWNSSTLYITFNPNQDELGYFAKAAFQVSSVTQGAGLYTKGTYTEDTDPINPNVPLKTCKDATDKITVLTMELSETQEGAFLEENCIYIRAKTGEGLVLIADKIRMNFVGIEL